MTNELKKKRGRKPKKKDIDITVCKVPKKRGRKPKNLEKKNISPSEVKKKDDFVIENFNKNGIDKTTSENVILHLSVHSDDIKNEISSVQPIEINTNGLSNNYAEISDKNDNNFSQYPFNNINLENTGLGIKKEINETWKTNNGISINNNSSWNLDKKDYSNLFNNNRFKNLGEYMEENYTIKSDYIMKQYIDSNKRDVWPNKTPIYCFWCCYPFQTKPCCLPVEINNNKYNVFGNFCCPECVASYSFYEYHNKEKKWERYNLINLFYSKKNENENLKIKLAPDRLLLDIFGGPLNIKQFRNLCNDYGKNIVVNYPPLVSIIPQIEESEYQPLKKFNKDDDEIFIPLDQERLDNASENLKLKRNKPFTDSHNTLETCMN